MNKYFNTYENEFKTNLYKHNNDYHIIYAANNIVKKFIIDKKIIISGGLAIDYALKLKGSNIYSETDIADYDCKSSNNVHDAYDLGEILYKEGFENVKVIRAKHSETMRVRVDLITVADITYIPEEYYNQLKTLKYQDMYILHPDIQRIDIHISISFPFKNSPNENIFFRWKKDISRFNLYEKHYPMDHYDIQYPIKEYNFTIPSIISIEQFAFNGFIAYAILSNEIKKYIDIINFPILNVDIDIDSKKCKIEMPFYDKLFLVTDTKNIEFFDKNNLYSEVLDIIPLSYHSEDIIIYFTDYLSIINIGKINIVNIQYLLIYFLYHYNFSNDIKNKNIYNNFYFYTLKMINIAETIDDINFNKSMFLPSLLSLGEEPDIIVDNKQDLFLPINYNPYKIGTRPEFDYSNFKKSGKKLY